MATVTVDTILKRCNTLLNDAIWVRWPKQELLDYYNDSVRAIVLHRPDANTSDIEFTCVAGTKQSLPTDALKLIDVVRNSSGKVIRYIDRAALDDNYPDWHTKSTSAYADAFTYDDRDPKVFYLYPGVAASTKINLVYSVAPQAKTLAQVENSASPAVADLDDIYINPIIDFILFRAYSKDADYVANSNRAQLHYQGFLQQIGDKTQVDNALSQAQTAQFPKSTQL